MAILEKYEWCDLWWDETDCMDLPRVVLIGDSIARGYRKAVSALLRGEALVDQLATSRAVDNPALLHELAYMLGEHSPRHDVVHLNNGLHGHHLSVAEYRIGLQQLIDFVVGHPQRPLLILVTSTPVSVLGCVEELDKQKNGSVVERNQAVRTLAQEYGLPVHDLYTAMLSHPEYRSSDGYHYTAEGQRVQAESVARSIRSMLRD